MLDLAAWLRVDVDADAPAESVPNLLSGLATRSTSPLSHASAAVDLGYASRKVFELRLDRLVRTFAGIYCPRRNAGGVRVAGSQAKFYLTDPVLAWLPGALREQVGRRGMAERCLDDRGPVPGGHCCHEVDPRPDAYGMGSSCSDGCCASGLSHRERGTVRGGLRSRGRNQTGRRCPAARRRSCGPSRGPCRDETPVRHELGPPRKERPSWTSSDSPRTRLPTDRLPMACSRQDSSSRTTPFCTWGGGSREDVIAR